MFGSEGKFLLIVYVYRVQANMNGERAIRVWIENENINVYRYAIKE